MSNRHLVRSATPTTAKSELIEALLGLHHPGAVTTGDDVFAVYEHCQAVIAATSAYVHAIAMREAEATGLSDLDRGDAEKIVGWLAEAAEEALFPMFKEAAAEVERGLSYEREYNHPANRHEREYRIAREYAGV